MMATTHAYLGLAVAILSLPETARHAPTSTVMAAAFIGGLLPDLDLITDHRKTLHFPVLLPVGSLVVLALYVIAGHPFLLVLGIVTASAGLHSLTDVCAGGLGYEPWKHDSQRAVYNHLLGRWHAPRRLVRYSGAPEDFALATAFAVPCIRTSATGPVADRLLLVVLAASGLYAAMRRSLPTIARRLRSRLPSALLDRLPQIQFER